MYALVNGEVFDGEDFEKGKAVLVDGAEVVGVVPEDGIPEGVETQDLRGRTVAPGFIDVQVNGGGGVLFNDSPGVETIRTIVEAHRRFGTTSLLPTFVTGSRKDMEAAAAAVSNYLEAGEPGVLGLHFEGPFILPERAGVHERRFIRALNDVDVKTVCSLRKGITLMTLAPEKVPTEQIKRLCDGGILVSLGHTNATYEEAMAAFDAGATCTTHLYNAMSPFAPRAPGMVGAALDRDDAWAGIIVDGHHASFAAVRLALRAKAPRKIFLVTDAVSPVGAEEKGFRIGEHDVEVKDGRCLTRSGILAGAALDMATAVRNLIHEVGVGRAEALRMASTYAAEFLGLGDRLGRIAPRYDADLVILDDDFRVSAVVVQGVFEGISNP